MSVQAPESATLEKLTRAVLVTVSGTLAISFYLIWRSVSATIGDLDPFGGETQVAEHGISFTFGAMTVLWPIVLGCFSFAAAYLLQRRAEFLGIREADKSALEAHDVVGALHGDSTARAIVHRKPKALAQLPTVALVALGLAPLSRLARFYLLEDQSMPGLQASHVYMLVPDWIFDVPIFALSILSILGSWKLARSFTDAWSRFWPFVSPDVDLAEGGGTPATLARIA